MTHSMVVQTVAQTSVTRAEEPAQSATLWRLLRLWNAFRIIVAIVLLALPFARTDAIAFGAAKPRLFLGVALVYLAFGGLVGISIAQRRLSASAITYSQLTADIVAVVLWLSASAGAVTGLGSLLFIPIAIASLLVSRRMALGAAAMATIALFGQQSLVVLQGAGRADYTQTAILGIVFFATALVAHHLASRLEESEVLAKQRGFDLANLAQLNDYIIQHMRTGVVALDAVGGVRLMNTAAANQLGLKRAQDSKTLATLSAPLNRALERWRQDHRRPPQPVHAPGGAVLVPHFTNLGESQSGTLIFLEDPSLISDQVRQMRLAALGRLTAGIAHEIRNPLAAVSHANQLLAESSTLSKDERRMSAIIGEHTARVNRIVENVLRLSRRDNVHIERLDLHSWLQNFAAEFSSYQNLNETALAVVCEGDFKELPVRVDRSHLHQVLWNLAENALRYAAPTIAQGGAPIIELATARAAPWALPCVKVLDRGPGVPGQLAENIFEPFYTSSARGTGLGLFIARELCECNGATLHYEPRVGGGSCFRIIFGDPQSWVV